MRKLWYPISIVLITLGSLNAQTDSKERQAIIATLKNETRYFCERDLKQWQAQWSRQPYVSKMYAGNTKFEEFSGWEAIRQFTVKHIAENPEPIPIPETLFNYEIYVSGKTAWVFYSKMVNGTLVKENRFMVMENGHWKIARMQTIF
ncbi:MAG: hypothetical protein AAGB24_11540 [Bacteroidota bacterium]